ncbi:MAG: hypothetical protein P8175_10620, partial [Deltaproteobacteria bacterium]
SEKGKNILPLFLFLRPVPGHILVLLGIQKPEPQRSEIGSQKKPDDRRQRRPSKSLKSFKALKSFKS